MVNLRYAFATLAGPWLLLVVLGLDAGTAALRGAPYLGEGMWTVRWAALSMLLLSTLVTAVAAVDAARLSRPGSVHLSVSLEGSRRYLWAAGWSAGAAFTAHLAVIVGMLAIGGVTHPRVGWGPMLLAVMAQGATIAWFACLGSALGRYVPPLTAGITGAVSAFVIGYTFLGGSIGAPGFSLLGDSGATVSQIGVTWNLTHLVVQIGVLGVTGFVMVYHSSVVASGRLRPRLRGSGGLILSAALLVAVQQFMPGRPLADAPEPPDVCVGSSPAVCYYSEHARYAGPTVALLTSLVEAADAAGYSSYVPERLEEASRRYNGADGETFAFGTLESGPVDAAAMVDSLLTPFWCPALTATEPPPDAYWLTSGQLAETWLRLVGDTYDPTLAGWDSLSPQQVDELMQARAQCKLGVEP